MKLWKKILIGLLCLAFLSQIPFLINHLKTGRLASQITEQESQRKQINSSRYTEYKGVIHAHSFLGGHSTGTFKELLSSAQANELDFVVMTEHVSDSYDTSAMTLTGENKGILFIGGNETSTKDGNRFLVLNGFPEISKVNKKAAPEFISEAHERNKLALVTYPHKFKAWNEDIDGIEIFSLHTNAKSMNPATFLFNAIWSYSSYPELTLAKYFRRPAKNLKKFDELAKNRKLTLFAGTDAHSNLGIHVGDDSNNKYINLKFDRYETIFKLVRNHILLPKDTELNQENLLAAIKNGNVFIGIDILGDSSGFSFIAENENEIKTLGEEILLESGRVELKSKSPKTARFVVFRNGEKAFEAENKSEINFTADREGAYRVEVYLNSLGSPFDQMPWIISNPIYVR